jgi:hypothetical protein
MRYAIVSLAVLMLGTVGWGQETAICYKQHIGKKGLTDVEHCRLASPEECYRINRDGSLSKSVCYKGSRKEERAVGWGQECNIDKGCKPTCEQKYAAAVTEIERLNHTWPTPDWRVTAMQCMDAYKQLDSSHKEIMGAMSECLKEVAQPRLPLGVNPGECYRIGGDMSLHLIKCPSDEEDLKFKEIPTINYDFDAR